MSQGFGLRRWPRRGYYGTGGGWQWDGEPMAAEIPTDDIADIGGLTEQIRVLASRVEALSARLDEKERNAG